MTIKTKLIINTLIILGALLVIVYVSISNINKVRQTIGTFSCSLTSYQVKMSNHQRAMGQHSINLISLANAVVKTDYEALKTKITSSLRDVQKSYQDLVADKKTLISNNSLRVADITSQMIQVVDQRVNSEKNKPMPNITDEIHELNSQMSLLVNSELLENYTVLAQVEKTQGGIIQSVNQALSDAVKDITVLGIVSLALLLIINTQLVFSVTRSLYYLVASIRYVEKTGDFSRQVKVRGKDEISTAGKLFNAHLASLSKTFTTLLSLVKNINASVGKSSIAVEQVSSGAEDQLSSLETVLSTVDLTSQVVSDVANSSQLASHNSRQAKERIEASRNDMEDLKKSMQAISENSNRINTSTSVISGIARQTNLLALNAAIEAARAGKYGSGFAVVADEVRKLAQHSANSAQEIATIIKQAVIDTETGVKVAQKVYDNMNQVTVLVEETDTMLQNIANTTSVTHDAVSTLITNVDGLKSIAINNTEASSELLSIAHEFKELASEGEEELSRFKV